jgi:hypothetical protein
MEDIDPEELEAAERAIPDWKKGAVILTDQEAKAEEKAGILRRMAKKVKSSVSSTESA